MKAIKLKEILKHMNHESVTGNTGIIISKVIRRVKFLSDNTLLFDWLGKDKSYPLELFKAVRNCAIVTKYPEKYSALGKNITVIGVNHVVQAYSAFVRYYRDMFKFPVIFITGTCGKTTTKDMTRHILQSRYNVLATHRSYNDLQFNLGYLNKIDESTEAAVIETGVAWPEDLLDYSRYFQPNVGVITKIGVDHLLGCKSLDGYINAKALMLKTMSYSGTLILNADDDNIKKIDLTPFKGKIIYFGLSSKADFRASHLSYFNDGMKYTLHYKGKSYRCFVPGPGEHNVYNALAAIAAVSSIGFDVSEAAKILSTFQHPEKHVQIRKGINGSLVIDDTWSTNPTSLEAALKVLKVLQRGRRSIVVLGYIDELGKHSAYYHALAGEIIAASRVNVLVTVGDEARAIAERAVKKGMHPGNVYHCKTSDQVFDIVSKLLNRKTVILFKKSMHVSFQKLMKQIIVR
jgi:UDP-N-acetylmuramoyl-tripeptide--D-alanyl-D-alanine ligase